MTITSHSESANSQIYVLEVFKRRKNELGEMEDTGELLTFLLVQIQETYSSHKDYDTGNKYSEIGEIILCFKTLPFSPFVVNSEEMFSAKYENGRIIFCNTYIIIEKSELRGSHIGSYFMNEVILWMKKWPNASIIKMDLNDARVNVNNKDSNDINEVIQRRNKFYANFGMKFNFFNEDKNKGTFIPMKVGELKTAHSMPTNMRKIDIFDFLEAQSFKLKNMEDNYRPLDNKIKELKKQLYQYEEKNRALTIRIFYMCIAIIFLFLLNII
jgi:hypothetical protein